ncbi:hypothetical protein P4O66_011560, partial [Electrophorus voltai]
MRTQPNAAVEAPAVPARSLVSNNGVLIRKRQLRCSASMSGSISTLENEVLLFLYQPWSRAGVSRSTPPRPRAPSPSPSLSRNPSSLQRALTRAGPRLAQAAGGPARAERSIHSPAKRQASALHPWNTVVFPHPRIKRLASTEICKHGPLLLSLSLKE